MVDAGRGPDGSNGSNGSNGPDEAALAIAARHALHDEELVAAFATGSLDDSVEVDRAQALIDRCTACRDLHLDIAAIGEALRLDARGTIPAPRDFRLSTEDARRLGRPASPRGVLARLRRSILGVARPAGATFATLGVVGLLVGSMTLGGGAALAPLGFGTGVNSASGDQPGAPKSSDRIAEMGPESSAPAPQVDGTQPRVSDVVAPVPSPVVWLLGGSVVLLVAGLALLLVAFRRGRGSGTPR